MKNQMNNTKKGTQVRVNNQSYVMQMAEFDNQMKREVLKEQMLLADLECQAEQDAALGQMLVKELAYEVERRNITEAIYVEALVCEPGAACF